MNEHDSERIAGLLEQDGMVPAVGPDDADVIVLNTCCIRENADNKLYGHLGHLRAAKDRRPDLQIAVAGCLAQKDRDLVRRTAPHVDVVFGTHNVGRAAELLQRARRDGPLTEIVDEFEEFPSALPVQREAGHAAWVTIQVGCDNSCAFCIVPAVRGPEISRPLHDVVAEVESLAAGGVTEVTLLGQNVNSYGRDLALAARRDGGTGPVRPLFAELLRRRRVGGRHPSGPLHEPPPEGPAGRHGGGDGRGAGRVRAPPPPAAVRQRRGAGGHAPRLHGAALPRPAGARPVRASRTWP